MSHSAFDPLQLEIQKFIFHVVHHGEEKPILMDDTPIEGFEIFFKKRISEVLDGNRFDFIDTSDFLQSLQKIEKDEKLFVPVSQDLANRFHEHQDNRIKPGVMILTKVNFQGRCKYILIKYDHEEVITYLQKGNKAVLQEIKNTFSKSKDSLQKSVIVDIEGDSTYAIVRDKSDSTNITRFFKNFLGITRKYTNQELTGKVKDAYLRTVTKNKDLLSNDYTSNAADLFYQTVQALDTFNAEDFSQRIFHNCYTPDLYKDFEKELKHRDISGETFSFDKNIRRPRKRKLMTKEGVVIQYPEAANDTVVIQNTGDKTIVTITTQKLHEESTGS